MLRVSVVLADSAGDWNPTYKGAFDSEYILPICDLPSGSQASVNSPVMSALPSPPTSASGQRDNPARRLYAFSQTFNGKDLPVYSKWIEDGKPVGTYEGKKPTYQLKIDEDRLDEFGTQSGLWNHALEIVFGQKVHSGWEVWVGGERLQDLTRAIRDKYEELEEVEKERAELGLLDLWCEQLHEKLRAM